MRVLTEVSQTVKTKIWWLMTIVVMVTVIEVTSLSGPNVCMVKQKYNITKRVKYRAPMSVRTYEWCFAMPPRCSKWNTEMRDVTRLETEERTAEMAVCCPGYKLRDVSCVPHCPSGKTGTSCSEDCPPNKWGPSCMHECKKCVHGSCDPTTGVCRCQDGWQGESCETSMTTTVAVGMMEQTLTTTKPAFPTKITTQTPPSSTTISYSVASTIAFTPMTTAYSKIKEKFETTTNLIKPSTRSIAESSFITKTTKVVFKNTSISTVPAPENSYEMITERLSKKIATGSSNYNRTEPPIEGSKTVPTVKLLPPTQISTTVTTILTKEATTSTLQHTTQVTTPPTTEFIPPVIKPTQNSKFTTALIATTETTLAPTKIESKKTETTVKQPSTSKLRPKEIWIRPAQKGESPSVESKIRHSQELPHPKSKTKESSEATTPKTIIVSIIPTSVSYTTFKKIVLSAVSASQKNDAFFSKSKPRAREQGYTKPMIMHTTSSPVTLKVSPRKISPTTTMNPVFFQNVTKTKSLTSSTVETFRSTVPTKTTNSMSSTLNASKRLNSSQLTTFISFSTNASRPVQKQNDSSVTSTSRSHVTTMPTFKKVTTVASTKESVEHRAFSKQSVFVTKSNFTVAQNSSQSIEEPRTWKTTLSKQANTNNKRILTNSNTTTKSITGDPTKDEETFHVLTEPEHITAVMGDKATESSTIDLISVISIAGGVMMAIITVAVVIVMLERCKRPRYEDVRKYNDIRMQVMIDKNDVPPPYVRSIFHTPLPDPPASEKCHYQPISTLDRNLKQFMRPVVVQTISPLMLENFRGILECHYDHLPRRSQDMGTMQTCCTMASSIGEREELLPRRVHSLSDSDIEAMKCEAKLDVIDNTTSEPLYAEIPCWRPPSARAIEVVNLNGEAVTEL